MTNHPLANVREKITNLDRKLLELLQERRALAVEVIKTKIAHNLPVKDVAREKALLNTLVDKGKEFGLSEFFIKDLYQIIIDDSVKLQSKILQEESNPSISEQVKIAFLGPNGSYSHNAMKHYALDNFSSPSELSFINFKDIFKAVVSGEADFAVIPIENTSSGSINEVYDLLQKTELHIVDELFLKIEHCILGVKGSSLNDITSLYSHPQPFQQCTQFLNHYPQWDIEYCDSTSSAVEKVAKFNDKSIAAIGNKDAAELYGLEILATDLADQKENITRFVVLAKEPVKVSQQLAAKTTILMKTGQQSGALVDALMIFRKHQIVMSKLESRPIHGTPWEEMFYIDLQGNVDDLDVQEALKDLKAITLFVKVLGCYPSKSRFEI